MERRIKFKSPFETAKEAGLVSIKEKVNLKTDWKSPNSECFLAPAPKGSFETHPLARKAHIYGSSLK